MPKKTEKQGKPLFDGNIGTKQLCHLARYKSEAVKLKLIAIKILFVLNWTSYFVFPFFKCIRFYTIAPTFFLDAFQPFLVCFNPGFLIIRKIFLDIQLCIAVESRFHWLWTQMPIISWYKFGRNIILRGHKIKA